VDRVKKRTTPASIVDQIIHSIQRGDYRQGERLPTEPELCATFGVGRNSLREAVRFLELAGVLEVRQGEGTFVATDETGLLGQALTLRVRLTPDSALQVIESRTVLEPGVAALAAAHATPVDLARLSATLGRMRTASNAEAFARADLEFHECLADATHNLVLRHMIGVLRTSVDEWIHKALQVTGSRDAAYAEHVAIFEAIRGRNSTAARSAMEAHLVDVGQRLLTVMEGKRLSRDGALPSAVPGARPSPIGRASAD
jgi:GntR family transcriptional repressor for pyruvate dehydrogenase complex